MKGRFAAAVSFLAERQRDAEAAHREAAISDRAVETAKAALNALYAECRSAALEAGREWLELAPQPLSEIEFRETTGAGDVLEHRTIDPNGSHRQQANMIGLNYPLGTNGSAAESVRDLLGDQFAGSRPPPDWALPPLPDEDGTDTSNPGIQRFMSAAAGDPDSPLNGSLE
jgi:hypothetical protein